MKCCLILGTDKLGAAPKILKQNFGVTEILHITGRKRKIPKSYINSADMIVVYTRYINHDLMWKIRKDAKLKNIPVKFVDRGLSELLVGGAA